MLTFTAVLCFCMCRHLIPFPLHSRSRQPIVDVVSIFIMLSALLRDLYMVNCAVSSCCVSCIATCACRSTRFDLKCFKHLPPYPVRLSLRSVVLYAHGAKDRTGPHVTTFMVFINETAPQFGYLNSSFDVVCKVTVCQYVDCHMLQFRALKVIFVETY